MAYTAIDDPEAYFQVKTYTGNGSTQSITFDGDTDMQPDFLWVKGRSVGESHYLQDSVRGVTKHLHTTNTDAEVTDTGVVTALNSDGFSLGDEGDINSDSGTFVAWGWKESATSGFDIVAYTGDGNAGNTEAHSLSAVPHLMIIKQRNGTGDWIVYHHKNTSAPETDHLTFKEAATSDALNKLNDVAPTSSIFTLGDGGDTNGSSDTYVNYLFSEKQGFSKFGEYPGNGSANGDFVFLGFRPAMVIVKGNNTESWSMYDDQREGYNVDNDVLYPNGSNAEGTSDDIDLLSNGFKIRRATGLLNDDAVGYVYCAWAKAPFVNSNGVPCNAR